MGRDLWLVHHALAELVSIHAPTWGATRRNAPIVEVVEFQSTRPRGARLEVLDTLAGDLAVSIHAPTWGATSPHGRGHLVDIVSIHAPTWGATDLPEFHDNDKEFQSTRPRGARQAAGS